MIIAAAIAIGLRATLAVLAGSLPAQDTAAAPLDREAAVKRGVEILLQRQENLDASEGSGPIHLGDPCEWPYEGVYRVREGRKGMIPLGYRIGGTAIASWALLEASGWDEDHARQSAVFRALGFILDGLKDPKMSPDFVRGYDVRGWGHAYALQFLLRLRELGRVPKDRETEVASAVSSLCAQLAESAIAGKGGWNYSRRDNPTPSTFMTAPTLQALFGAKKAGERFAKDAVELALSSLEKSRLDSGAYQYGLSSRRTDEGFDAVEGATGRTPVCETTLWLAGKGDVDRLRFSVRAFLEHWQHLEDRRQKTGTHVPPFMIAPYYFFYAHFYAAQAIELLPTKERPALRARLDRRLVQVREESGGWNDRVFDRSEAFGTAMVILALRAPHMPRPSGWGKSSDSSD